MERLGRYEIVRHWASGGMAQVLLARTTGIGGFERYVVVKRIHTEHAKDERFVRMFLDEARLAAMLHHGNIVQVHEVGEAEGRIFFAMEYVHGEELRRALKSLNVAKQKMPLEHVVAIVSATADALHHAHEQLSPTGKPLGLVHRDITPANIIIGYDGIVKVVDFGIAKAALRTTETAGGTLKGKVAYMSPEQCLGKPVDRRSDVYSLGVVLYETTCVRRLFKGDNDFLTMSSIIAGKIPPPVAHRADVPEELGKIIMKALAMRPEDRFQTAAEMGAALEQFASNAGLRSTPKGLAGFMKQRFGSRPEPWLVEGAPELAATDFDGSENGLVAPPMQALENLAIPQEVVSSSSAPIVRARKNAVTDKLSPAQLAPKHRPSPGARRRNEGARPVIGGAQLEASPTTAEAVDDGWGAVDKDASPSVAPVAFPEGSKTITGSSLRNRLERARATLSSWFGQSRQRQIAVGSAALVLLIFFIYLGVRSGPSHPAPTHELATPTPTAPVVTPTPAPDTTTTAPATQPAIKPQPVTTPETKPAVKPKPAISKPPEKKKRPKPKFIF